MLQATNGADVSTVPWNDKTMIKRVLDTGPDGIIVPLVNTREEAEYAVRAMKYPPLGERGAGLSRAQCHGLRMGEYMETANDEVTTILMIEHIDAVRNIDQILQRCSPRASAPTYPAHHRRQPGGGQSPHQGFTDIILGLDVLYLLGGATTALSQVERPR